MFAVAGFISTVTGGRVTVAAVVTRRVGISSDGGRVTTGVSGARVGARSLTGITVTRVV